MTRKTWILSISALFLLVPLSAQALGISITGVSTSGADIRLLQTGDILTVDLHVENGTGEAIFGTEIAARGYDIDANGIADNGLVFLGGENGSSVFNIVENSGSFFGGVPNVVGGVQERGHPFFEPPPTDPVELQALLFGGLAIDGATGDGTLDPAVDGGVTGAGGAHFRVQFQVAGAEMAGIVNPTSRTLEFGNFVDLGRVTIGAGGEVLSFGNDDFTFSIIPEPGTALLLGLGLAGLASRRR
jgi:hypothetical protein